MKIGILTHCVATNFGANLQALSTAYFLRNNGHKPYFFYWNTYLKNKNTLIIQEQITLHETILKRHGFDVSEPCVKNEDFVNIIDREKIEAIIVGSDAVLTTKSWIDSIHIGFKGIRILPIQDDYKYPNPFWLTFLNNDHNKFIKKILLSPSCQSSNYKYLSFKIRRQMQRQLLSFNFVSARDSYTRKMILDLCNNKIDVDVTPDPVFNFLDNVPIVISKKEIINKYKLPDKYILVSFFNYCTPSIKWFEKLKQSAQKRGFNCVVLPMPNGTVIEGLDFNIKLPIDPLDWFHLIKYASGYIGNNMHPIIVSILNTTPFFSIDQHGKFLFHGRVQLSKSSKTYDLLTNLGLIEYRIAQKSLYSVTTDSIIDHIISFDLQKCSDSAKLMKARYLLMMNHILDTLNED